MAAIDETPAGKLALAQLHQILGYQLAQAAITTTGVFAQEVGQAFDIRPVEYTLLTLIAENPLVSSAKLAKALAVTKPNITVWVDKLEARKLVQRRPSTSDKRATELRVTPSGAKLAAQATIRLLAAEQAQLNRLSAAERAMLIELLHKVSISR